MPRKDRQNIPRPEYKVGDTVMTGAGADRKIGEVMEVIISITKTGPAVKYATDFNMAGEYVDEKAITGRVTVEKKRAPRTRKKPVTAATTAPTEPSVAEMNAAPSH